MERRRIAYTVCMGLALMFVSNAALAQYQLTNLDSNQVGTAKHTDPLIVNAWGLVHARAHLGGSATTTPDGRRFTMAPET